MFKNVKKRDGRVVPFDPSKITSALTRAGKAADEFGESQAKRLMIRVLNLAYDLPLGTTPDVEEIQDIVERVLLDSSFNNTAKKYIIYRELAQIRTIYSKASADLVED